VAKHAAATVSVGASTEIGRKIPQTVTLLFLHARIVELWPFCPLDTNRPLKETT
jgi:hypothetical protein